MTSDFLTAFAKGVNTGQGGAEVAAFALACGGMVIRYLTSKRSQAAAPTTPVAVAVAPPLIDPKQVEQVVEAISRFNAQLDDIKGSLAGMEVLLGRIDASAGRAGNAAYAVETALRGGKAP